MSESGIRTQASLVGRSSWRLPSFLLLISDGLCWPGRPGEPRDRLVNVVMDTPACLLFTEHSEVTATLRDCLPTYDVSFTSAPVSHVWTWFILAYLKLLYFTPALQTRSTDKRLRIDEAIRKTAR